MNGDESNVEISKIRIDGQHEARRMKPSVFGERKNPGVRDESSRDVMNDGRTAMDPSRYSHHRQRHNKDTGQHDVQSGKPKR